MNLAIPIVVAAVAAAPAANAKHARYMEVHREWVRIHSLEARPPNAPLVIDPREQAMWIEVDGKVHGNSTVALPAAAQWYAFHVTERGIIERSFPVRLTRPQTNVSDNASAEQLWIVGVSKNQSWQCSFSASESAHTFHVGSGSGIDEITLRLPAKPAAPAAARDPLRSFVAVQSPRTPQPRETIQTKHFVVRVVRESRR